MTDPTVFNRSPSYQSSQPGAFATERLPLAIYLHATQTLPFIRCESARSGKIRFVFEDPYNAGSQAELEFDRGGEVAASDLFASQKFLRRKMSEANHEHTDTRKSYARK